MGPGSIVDDYCVERELGRGQHGVVYLVSHTQLNVHRALKVPLAIDESSRDRLVAEGRAQARLHHPNLVAVFDLVYVDEIPSLVMEYVAGGTLARWMNGRQLKPAEAEQIFRQICEGVAAAHRAGFTHGDLKPANILVDSSGPTTRVKVSDFGLSALTHALRTELTPDTNVGTLLYAAPERTRRATILGRAHALSSRSDVFSLGCILFELCTGTHPFAARTPLQALQRARMGAWPRDVAMPRSCARVVEACLQVEPERRPADAGAVLELLARPVWRVLPAALAAGMAVSALAAYLVASDPGTPAPRPAMPDPGAPSTNAASPPANATASAATAGPIEAGAPTPAAESAGRPQDLVTRILLSSQGAVVGKDPETGRLYALLSEESQVTCARSLLGAARDLEDQHLSFVTPDEALCGDHVAVRETSDGFTAIIVSGCGRGRTFTLGRTAGAVSEGRRLDGAGVRDWLHLGEPRTQGAAARGDDPWSLTSATLRCPMPLATIDSGDPTTTQGASAIYGTPPQAIEPIVHSLLYNGHMVFFFRNMLVDLLATDWDSIQELLQDEQYREMFSGLQTDPAKRRGSTGLQDVLNADWPTDRNGQMLLLKTQPWFATFSERAADDIVVKVLALGGANRGRLFSISLRHGEPRERARLSESEVVAQLSQPHLGGLAEPASSAASAPPRVQDAR